MLLPLAFLVVQAQDSGWGTLRRLLLRHSTVVLLWNTVRLTIACTVLCAVLGVGAAWLVRRSDLPLRRLWAVLLVLAARRARLRGRLRLGLDRARRCTATWRR